MTLKQAIYFAGIDLRTLNSAGARYSYTELEAKVRKARKIVSKLKSKGNARR